MAPTYLVDDFTVQFKVNSYEKFYMIIFGHV